MPVTQINGQLDAYDSEAITVDNTSGGVGFSAAKIKKQMGSSSQTYRAVEAFITVETASLRFTLDGSAPTSAVGHLLNAGDSIVIIGVGNINRFKAIRTGGTSAAITVTYYA